MAEEQKKGTIYQQLNQLLNLDGFGYADAQPTVMPQSTPATSKETKVIIKGATPEEIKRKGLELEQKRELQNKFFRTTDRGFQKALQYEAARLPAYSLVRSDDGTAKVEHTKPFGSRLTFLQQLEPIKLWPPQVLRP